MTKEEAQKAYNDLVAYRKQNVLIKSKEHPGRIEIHHIIPTSMNGLDVEENKIALLAKEHFMAHVYLWIIHHDDEFHDQMLCALMNMHKGTVNGSRKELRDFILMSEDYQQAREEFGKLASKIASEANKGENNPMKKRCWIRNPTTKESKVILKSEMLPDGWEYGMYQTITDKVISQLKEFSQSTKNKCKIFNPNTNEVKYINKDDPIPFSFEKRGKPLNEHGKMMLKHFYMKKRENEIKPKRIAELRPMYEYYVNHGWQKFKEHFDYQYSQANFVGLCKCYLPEYKSSRGKKRG